MVSAHDAPHVNAEKAAGMTDRERSMWRTMVAVGNDYESAVTLLREVRDLLWHNPDAHGDMHPASLAANCIGCRIEERIDVLLENHDAHTDGSSDA
jgi:hypothetical protein